MMVLEDVELSVERDAGKLEKDVAGRDGADHIARHSRQTL